jgi:hypothetical protein
MTNAGSGKNDTKRNPHIKKDSITEARKKERKRNV